MRNLMRTKVALGIALIAFVTLDAYGREIQKPVVVRGMERLEPEIQDHFIRGMERLEPEIQDHFISLISEGFESLSDEGSLTMIDNGYEKFLVFDTGDELRMYLIVRDEDGKFKTALRLSVELPDASIADGEEVELVTTVLASDLKILQRSARFSEMRKAITKGESLTSIVAKQASIQSNIQVGPEIQAAGIEVSCVGNGDAICCGFSDTGKIRIICVCNSGSQVWTVCFDSGWLK